MSPDSRLESLRRRQAHRYVARFDRGEFWLAHEEMEELWQEDRDDAYKGLIQIAAGMLHAERGNWRGARRLLDTALGYLEDAPRRFRGFDVAGIRRHVSRLLEEVSRRAETPVEEADDGDGLAPGFRMADHFDEPVDVQGVEDEEVPYRVRRYDEGYDPVGGGSGS